MSTGLHVRKKPSLQDDHDPEMATSPAFLDGDDKDKTRVRPSVFRQMIRSEIGCAIEVILGFLFFGLVLGYFVLHHQHRKVVVHIMHDPLGHGAALKGRVGFRHHFYTGHPRTVTVVMPSVVNPKGRKKRLESIQETWGATARAVYVVHDVEEFPVASHAVISDDRSPEDPYAYPQLMLIPEAIGSEDGVARLFHTIRTVFTKINPDFAFFVNDHTFVIPEHLCKYLEHQNPEKDMYHGHAMKDSDKVAFNSGAAGYVLSRETMRGLVDKWDHGQCTSENASKWLQGNPGLLTTQCLKDELGVVAIDTRYHEKFHRFHAFPLNRVVTGEVDEWYINKHKDMDKKFQGFPPSYNTLLPGPDCCAPDTVSFHYVEFKESGALFATREALLENPHLTDHELKNLMVAEWPRERQEVGYYSKGLPNESDEGQWKDLLEVVRKISSRRTQAEC